MAYLSFLYPFYLLFLFLVPVFFLIYFLAIIYNKKKSVVFSNFKVLERFSGLQIFSKNYLLLFLNIIFLIVLVFTFSGSVLHFDSDTAHSPYIVLIDNSNSMKTVDVSPDRLSFAKSYAKSFVNLLPFGTEVAVATFSGEIKVVQKFDSFRQNTLYSIDSIGFSQIEGTNLYDALITLNRLFEPGDMKSLILFSDGQINYGNISDIIDFSQLNNLVINTVVIGTKEGGVTEFGTISKTNEDILNALSFETGGAFLYPENITNELELLSDDFVREVSINLSFYLMIFSLFIFLVIWTLHNFRFRIFP